MNYKADNRTIRLWNNNYATKKSFRDILDSRLNNGLNQMWPS